MICGTCSTSALTTLNCQGSFGRRAPSQRSPMPTGFSRRWPARYRFADADGEPLWLMLVGPSSGSKAETVRMVPADHREYDLTLAGLLSRRPRKNGSGEPTWPVRRSRRWLQCDRDGLGYVLAATRGTSSGTMSGQQQAGIFETLRDIYDRAYSRRMDQVNPRWEGRVTSPKHIADVHLARFSRRSRRTSRISTCAYYHLHVARALTDEASQIVDSG